ncbi:MAG: hypothetical protein A3I01_01515 [Betaproteobacteria bacterium RIFCSPLOWO2_02_FULL_65_24]|nr:MAG: hypothetical protein A3I01_01515 [Betaproteobacteria bacterium RIFCSPLOWO2_02_FULL_65_24]
MEAKIITIGNSKGVRLPRHMLRQCELAEGQAVDIDVRQKTIVITPKAAASLRAQWDARFARAGARRVRENLWGDVPLDEAWDR